MKLKDKPLEYWRNKKYISWCKADVNDERRINYHLTMCTLAGDKLFSFTSDEYIEPIMLDRVQRSTIKEIQLFNNEWFVKLEC